jgi:hypothetical protein
MAPSHGLDLRIHHWGSSMSLHGSSLLKMLTIDSQVYSIVAPFVKRCPVSNPRLPLQAFPELVAFPANAPSGAEVTYTFKSAPGRTYYAAYYSGLAVKIVKLNKKKATVPDGLRGTYYTVIVSRVPLLCCSGILTLGHLFTDLVFRH